jgi:uncharacterized protein YlzI (FlbEa/FlbD family)
MIVLTGVAGERFGVNPDLIVMVVATAGGPTIVELVTGDRYHVLETVDEVADRMLTYRTAIVNGPATATGTSPRLRVIQPN